jgi:hypothetical protein
MMSIMMYSHELQFVADLRAADGEGGSPAAG